MNKLKYIVAVLIALAGLGLQQAKADTIYTLSAGNTALTSAGFTGPYATVDVHLVTSDTATVTFTGLTQTISGTTYQYLFGDSSSVGVNVNASSWTISGITGTNSGTGFTPGPYSDGGSGQVDGFGVVNQTVTDFDGFKNSASVVTFVLTNQTTTLWTSSSSVLIANSQGTIVAAHIFVTTSPANASNSALVTGFAANGGAVNTPDGGTTVMLLGAALGALGMARRFLMS
jgi:hypothetical protein